MYIYIYIYIHIWATVGRRGRRFRGPRHSFLTPRQRVWSRVFGLDTSARGREFISSFLRDHAKTILEQGGRQGESRGMAWNISYVGDSSAYDVKALGLCGMSGAEARLPRGGPLVQRCIYN